MKNPVIKYDRACRALAAAVSVDEVKHIRAEAEAMKAYARIAKNPKLIADATMIKLRAERRLGELMAAQAKSVGKAKGGAEKGVGRRGNARSGKTRIVPTLAEAGIDVNLANRARKAAKVPEKVFEKEVVAIGEEIIATAGRRMTQGNKKERRATRERELGAKQRAMPEKKFGVVYVDPAWKFEVWNEDTGSDRAAENHYPTMSLDAIKVLTVSAISAADSVLFLWATVPMLPQALDVMKHWGFEYRSSFVWVKPKAITGYWNRNRHELLLVGAKGKPPAPAMGTQWASVIEAPQGPHSAKPEAVLEMIEAYFPTLPKIELNRRGPARPGWDAWGNEAEA